MNSEASNHIFSLSLSLIDYYELIIFPYFLKPSYFNSSIQKMKGPTYEDFVIEITCVLTRNPLIRGNNGR